MSEHQRLESAKSMAAMSICSARNADPAAHEEVRSLLAVGEVEGVADVEGPVGGHVDHSGDSELIKFLADPGDGVFVDCLAGDSDLVRLTKTNGTDVPVTPRDADGRHGQTVESRQCLLHFERILRGDQGRGKPVPDADRVLHDDSSTGDGPAATGSTDRVEVAARQSGDSCSGGHAESEAHQRYLDSCSREEAYAEACRDVAEWAELMVEAQDNGEPGEADVCRRRMALHVAAMKAARDR